MPACFALQSTHHAAALRAAARLLLAAAACGEAPLPSPLQIAAAGNQVETVQALLAAQPAPDADALQAALALAAENGASRTARALLDAGARIDGGDRRPDSGWTPLIIAVHHGRWATARDLLAWGADPNAAAPDGTTPLMMITDESDDEWHLRMVEDLLLAGADPRLRTPDGETALTNAVSGGNPHIAVRLLAAAPDLRLDGGLTGAVTGVMATLQGNDELLDRARGIAPEGEDWPPFLLLVRDGSVEQVLVALAEGADARGRTSIGRTALMVAVERGDPELVRALLDAAPGLRLAPCLETERIVFRLRMLRHDELLALLRERDALPSDE